jgi:hypothetical protein
MAQQFKLQHGDEFAFVCNHLPKALSDETIVLGLWLLGCWVARLGFTANAFEDIDLYPQP